MGNAYTVPGSAYTAVVSNPSGRRSGVVLSSGPETPLEASLLLTEVGTAAVAMYGEGTANVLVGSTVGIVVRPGDAFPPSCYIQGLVNGTGAGGTQTVDVYVRDAYFNPVSNVTIGAGINVTVTFSDAPGGAVQPVVVSPLAYQPPSGTSARAATAGVTAGTSIPTVNGRTSWAFETAAAGRYTVSVTVQRQHVLGSPVTVTVLPLLDPVAVAAAFSSSSSPQQSLVVEFGSPVWDPSPLPRPPNSTTSTSNSNNNNNSSINDTNSENNTTSPAGAATGGVGARAKQDAAFLRRVLLLGQSGCKDIFSNETISLMGAPSPVCVWTDPSRLLVYPGYASALSPYTHLPADDMANATLTFLDPQTAGKSALGKAFAAQASGGAPLSLAVGPAPGTPEADLPLSPALQEMQDLAASVVLKGTPATMSLYGNSIGYSGAGALVVVQLWGPGGVGACDPVRLQAALSGAAFAASAGSQLAYRWQAYPNNGEQDPALNALLAKEKGPLLTVAPGILKPNTTYQVCPRYHSTSKVYPGGFPPGIPALGAARGVPL